MKRIVGLLLGIAGLLCLVAAAVLLLVTPQFIRLPDRGTLPTAVLEAPKARVMQPGTGSQQASQVDLRSTIRMQADGKTDDGAVIWKASQETVLPGATTPVSASESRVALDARSGAGVQWSGQCMADQPAPCQAGNVKYTGQLYAFPFGTEKKTYQFFDTTLRAALPIAYVKDETVNGLDTYRFYQAVPDQQSSLDAETLASLTASLPPEARDAVAGATMHYQSSRTVWVEPVTGSIINYRERVQRFIQLPVGYRIPLLDADFQYTPQTQTEIAAEASDGKTVIRILRWYLPAGLVVLGLIALVVGLLLVRRSRPTRTAPGVANEA